MQIDTSAAAVDINENVETKPETVSTRTRSASLPNSKSFKIQISAGERWVKVEQSRISTSRNKYKLFQETALTKAGLANPQPIQLMQKLFDSIKLLAMTHPKGERSKSEHRVSLVISDDARKYLQGCVSSSRGELNFDFESLMTETDGRIISVLGEAMTLTAAKWLNSPNDVSAAGARVLVRDSRQFRDHPAISNLRDLLQQTSSSVA